MLPDLNFIKLQQRQDYSQQTSSQLHPTNPTRSHQNTELPMMEFGTSGMLNEGKLVLLELCLAHDS
jgi:hypothetical protein